MADIVAVPVHEFPIFETALCLMGVLPPDEVAELLEQRAPRWRCGPPGSAERCSS